MAQPSEREKLQAEREQLAEVLRMAHALEQGVRARLERRYAETGAALDQSTAKD